MHRITPLPAGPSGKSTTLMLPASRWNDPSHSSVRFKQCPMIAMLRAGWPTATTTSSSSDVPFETSSTKLSHAALDWSHNARATSFSDPLSQPGCVKSYVDTGKTNKIHKLGQESLRRGSAHVCMFLSYLFRLLENGVDIKIRYLLRLHIARHAVGSQAVCSFLNLQTTYQIMQYSLSLSYEKESILLLKLYWLSQGLFLNCC